jgi:hypothetical protein
MKRAAERVYADKTGTNLVRAGDPAARVLVASAGRVLPEARLSKYSNVADFFEDIPEKPRPVKPVTKARTTSGKKKVANEPKEPDEQEPE